MAELESAMQKQFDLARTLNTRISLVQGQSQALAAQLKSNKQANLDSSLQQMAYNCSQSLSAAGCRLKNYRTLSGHFDKISSVAWYPDNINVVSSSQDGYLLVWDSTSGLKKNLVELDDPYVMACDVSADGQLVATGGLDNTCTVYKVNTTFQGQENSSSSLMSILKGHREYISDLGFLDRSRLVTCSGDRSSILWDTQKGGHVRYFYGHLGDILSLSVNKAQNGNTFATCSCDRLAMIWDIREPLATRKFLVNNNNSDPNVIKYCPDGYTFAVGSEEGNIRLYDLRSDGVLGSYDVDELQKYVDDNPQLKKCMPPLGASYDMQSQAGSYRQSVHSTMDVSGVVSLDFSHSGRLMFSAYAENTCVYIWDVIRGEVVGNLKGHGDVISKISVSHDGLGVATASRDETVKIWSI